MQPDQSIRGGKPRISDRKPAGQAAARNATLINLFVAPGLGSLLGRRVLEGLGQIVVAVVGFTLFVLWFVNVMVQYYGLINGQENEFHSRAWLGITGIIIFAVAWLWALATSISLVRNAARDDQERRNQLGQQQDVAGSK